MFDLMLKGEPDDDRRDLSVEHWSRDGHMVIVLLKRMIIHLPKANTR